MMKKRCKSAMVSVEVIIGVSLAVVALIVAVGLFSNNLSTLVANAKFSNIFTGADSKTQYTSFNREYSNSQIEVQIMGEQGLSMLRKRANNKAIELIEESFSQSNTNANSIAYLGTAIKAITGESNICVYMKNNSDKHCNEIGGYNYVLDVSGAALTISKANPAASEVNKKIVLPIESSVSSIIGSSTIPIGSDGYSTFTKDQKYAFINDLTAKLISYLRSDVLLIVISTTNKTQKSTKKVESLIDNLTNSVINSMIKDSNQSCGGRCEVGSSEINYVKTWLSSFKTNLNSSTDPKSYIISALKDNYTANAVNNMKQKRGCSAFRDNIVNLLNGYELTAGDVGITINGRNLTTSAGGYCDW